MKTRDRASNVWKEEAEGLVMRKTTFEKKGGSVWDMLPLTLILLALPANKT